MMYDSEALDVIESKIHELELKLYGADSESLNDNSNVIDSLLKANTLLTSVVSGTEKPLFERLRELNHYIDINPITDDPTGMITKLHVILSMENELRNSIDVLEKVKEVKDVLDDGSIKNAEDLKNELNSIISNHLSNRERLQEVNAGVEHLLCNFNEICLELSKSFFVLNEAIVKLEEKAKV